MRAASNNPRQFLGQFLLHYELVTEEQLQHAYRTQNETGVRLGRILVMIGLGPEEQVIQCLRVRVAETMLHAFRWTEGRFRLIDERMDDGTVEISLAVPLIDIHTEGHSREETWQVYDRLFPDPMTQVTVNDVRLPRTMPPGSFRERLLKLARRGLNIEALMLETHASDHALAKELVDLHRAGVVAPRQPTTTMSMHIELPGQGQSHLDLAQQALDEGRYSDALEHARAGTVERPGDPRAVALVSRLDDLARDQSADHPPRSALPVFVKEPDPTELKQLSAKERYIVARIDGKRSVQAIMQVSPMHDVEALDIIRAFHRDGWIRLEQLNGQSGLTSEP